MTGVVGGVEQQGELAVRGPRFEDVAHRRRVGVGDSMPAKTTVNGSPSGMGLSGDLGGQLEARQPADRRRSAASGPGPGWW